MVFEIINNNIFMSKVVYKHSKDALTRVAYIVAGVSGIYFFVTLGFAKPETIFPYYAGSMLACSIAAVVVLLWKGRHNGWNDLYMWLGAILPVVYTATVFISWLSSSGVLINLFGIKLLKILFFLAFIITLQYCKDDDCKSFAYLYVYYIISCMLLTEMDIL